MDLAVSPRLSKSHFSSLLAPSTWQLFWGVNAASFPAPVPTVRYPPSFSSLPRFISFILFICTHRRARERFKVIIAVHFIFALHIFELHRLSPVSTTYQFLSYIEHFRKGGLLSQPLFCNLLPQCFQESNWDVLKESLIFIKQEE